MELSACISNSKANMEKGFRRLSQLEVKLTDLELEMMPLYERTQGLSIARNNIDACVEQLRNVASRLEAPEKAKLVLLNARYAPQSAAYRKAVDSLCESVYFLEDNLESIPYSKTILIMSKSLLHDALEKSEGAFCDILKKMPCQYENELEKDGRSMVDELKLLGQQLDQCGHCSMKNQTYSKTRKEVVEQSYQSMVEKLNISHGLHVHNIRSFIQFEHEVCFRIFSDPVVGYAKYCDTIRYAILEFCSHIELEVKKMISIHAVPSMSTVLEFLQLNKDISDLSDEILQLLAPPMEIDALNVDMTLQRRAASFFKNFPSMMVQMLLNCQTCILAEFEDRSPASNIGIHPATKKLAEFMVHVHTAAELISRILPKGKDKSVTSMLCDILIAYEKSIQIEKQFRSHEFLVFATNNLRYMAHRGNRMLKKDAKFKSSLHEAVQHIIHTSESIIDMELEQSASSMTRHLQDPKNPLVYQKGIKLLTLDSGRQLKEKFSQFNLALEEFQRTYQPMSFMDVSVREACVKQYKLSIVVVYTTFYEKYAKIPFSKKNTSKYVKYTPDAVNGVIDKLYAGN